MGMIIQATLPFVLDIMMFYQVLVQIAVLSLHLVMGKSM